MAPDARASSSTCRSTKRSFWRLFGAWLADDGPLARQKVFSRRHLLVELAPLVYGWQPQGVDAVAARVLADPDVVPLVGVGGAIEPAHALASVIAREEVIAERIATQLDRSDAPVVTPETVASAIAETEERVGRELAGEQRQAVEAICSSGRGVELVVGVVGAGKTTMLAAVAAAFETSGCRVLGAATAGQAARTLAAGADLQASSTLASLTGRLERDQLHLGERSVVILDEAGMTDDIDLVRLATHVQLAGAKLVVVGDHRQLGAVGPGGSLAALVARHPDAVHHLPENRRQTDPGERQALEDLRDGDISRAVEWYADRSRIRALAERDGVLQAAVEGGGRHRRRRRNRPLGVAAGECGRAQHPGPRLDGTFGRLTGPELDVDGVAYRAGDRVVALVPDHAVGLVTSQRAVITTVHPDTGTVILCTDDDRQITLGADQLGPDRIGHSYATTVHRFQGSTVERAHLLADGGGRELAYVAMSRARHVSTAYVVADDLDQAREDLTRDWATRRTPTWAIDTALPTPNQASSAPQAVGERDRQGSSPSATPATGSSPPPPAPDGRPHPPSRPRRSEPPSPRAATTSPTWSRPPPIPPPRSATQSVTLTPLGHGSPSSRTPPLPAGGGNAAKPAAICLPPPPPQLPPRSISSASSPTSEGGSSRRS